MEKIDLIYWLLSRILLSRKCFTVISSEDLCWMCKNPKDSIELFVLCIEGRETLVGEARKILGWKTEEDRKITRNNLKLTEFLGDVVALQKIFASLSDDDIKWASENTKDAIAIFVEFLRNRNLLYNKFIIFRFLPECG